MLSLGGRRDQFGGFAQSMGGNERMARMHRLQVAREVIDPVPGLFGDALDGGGHLPPR